MGLLDLQDGVLAVSGPRGDDESRGRARLEELAEDETPACDQTLAGQR
jgi:hypothetical protein